MLQHLNCQLIDRIKLPVYFFTTNITTIPVIIAITKVVITATDKEIENVYIYTANKLMFSEGASCDLTENYNVLTLS